MRALAQMLEGKALDYSAFGRGNLARHSNLWWGLGRALVNVRELVHW